MPSKMCMSFFIQLKIDFLRKHYRHFLHIVDLNVANGLKVQIADLMQLQSTLHDPSQGIRVLHSRKICHFLKKTNKKACMYFLTTNAHLALARLPALRNQVAKVTRDVGGSSDPVLTKQTCKKSQTPFKKKKKKKTGNTMMSVDFEVGGENYMNSKYTDKELPARDFPNRECMKSWMCMHQRAS